MENWDFSEADCHYRGKKKGDDARIENSWWIDEESIGW